MIRNWKGAIGFITWPDGTKFEVFTVCGGPEEKNTVREMIQDKNARIIWTGKADIGEFIPGNDTIWKKKPCVVFKEGDRIVKILI